MKRIRHWRVRFFLFYCIRHTGIYQLYVIFRSAKMKHSIQRKHSMNVIQALIGNTIDALTRQYLELKTFYNRGHKRHLQ